MTEENERHMNELAVRISLKQAEVLQEKCTQAKPDENNEAGIKSEFEPLDSINNTLLKK
ncbi:hypothetical protein LQZ19_14145 [Treponema primitia]|uniref:hypothetical protein n=1 Tax=Treponema primitia TaxID=88058 RepID=UPI0039810D7F